MSLKNHLILFSLFFAFFTSTSAAESSFIFPCDYKYSPFLSASEHSITKKVDLKEQYAVQVAYWSDDVSWSYDELMIDSGSVIILDDQFMILSLRFSEDFDYETNERFLPVEIMLCNFDPNVEDDTITSLPEWRVMIYPDQDDPYAFYYVSTWNETMSCIRFYGNYIDKMGEHIEDFSLHVDL